MNHERCEHTASPVEVMTVGGGKKKKIAYCLGCGRSGPVCRTSLEAVTALRKMPQVNSPKFA